MISPTSPLARCEEEKEGKVSGGEDTTGEMNGYVTHSLICLITALYPSVRGRRRMENDTMGIRMAKVSSVMEVGI